MNTLTLDNEKLEKQEASKTLLTLFGPRVLLSDKVKCREDAVKESACDRDGDVLRDQVISVIIIIICIALYLSDDVFLVCVCAACSVEHASAQAATSAGVWSDHRPRHCGT